MEEDRYIFCPNCGALMQNGKCMNCGYGAGEEAGEASDILVEQTGTAEETVQADMESMGRDGIEASVSPDYSAGVDQPYPGGQPNPDNNGSQPYPGDAGSQPYPGGAGNQPNPGGQPYAPGGGNQPYSGGQPYSGNAGNQPYPGGAGNPSYSGGQPYPGNAGNQPNSGGQPYPGNAGNQPNSEGQPYPGNAGNQPNPGGQPYPGNPGAGYLPTPGGQPFQGNAGYQQNGQPYQNGPGYQQNNWQYQNRNAYQQEYEVILPEKNKGNNKALVAVIISAIAILGCFAMVLVFVLVKNAVEEGSSSFSQTTDSYAGDRKDKGNSFPGNGSYSHRSDEEAAADENENYVPSAEDEYYVTLANSVREDLSYTVEWEDFDYTDDETRASVKGRYPQLVGGNIPNMEALNEQIETAVTYFRDYYGYYKQGSDSGFYYNAESIGYVTYMDEEQISVVISDHFSSDSGSYVSLYAININLLSGKVLDNGQMIDYSEELAKAFRKQNEFQNSSDARDTLKLLDDSELQDFLSDPDTNIIFYTPVGLEIGFNYSTTNSSGWITATIKEYERYLKKI